MSSPSVFQSLSPGEAGKQRRQVMSLSLVDHTVHSSHSPAVQQRSMFRLER
jgi:hypothetical protein